MNKKFSLVMLMLVIISLISFVICNSVTPSNDYNKKIATSFYPTYLITENLLNDIDNVDVVNIADKVKGCVHNFQLTPENMKTLEKSDVLVINGMGMENYISDVISNVKNIDVIDSSLNIDGIENKCHIHHNHEESHEEEYNSHIWLSIDRYKKQVNNIAKALCDLDYLSDDKIIQNRDNYLNRINSLEEKKKETYSKIADKNIKTITFHDSFVYLLEDFNIKILKNLDVESEAGLSAMETKEAINLIKENNIKYIIADKTLRKEIPETLQKETGVEIIYLNSLLQNESNDLDSYIKGMEENLIKLSEIGD